MSWVGIALLGVAGFLLGGVTSIWGSSRLLAGVFGIAAALATAAGIVWLL
jgi:hypothetical protein